MFCFLVSEGGNATARFRQSAYWLGSPLATRSAGAAAGDAHDRVYEWWLARRVRAPVGCIWARLGRDGLHRAPERRYRISVGGGWSSQVLWHTLRGYVRDADMFRDHAGSGLL
jgi:hypothetical protein